VNIVNLGKIQSSKPDSPTIITPGLGGVVATNSYSKVHQNGRLLFTASSLDESTVVNGVTYAAGEYFPCFTIEIADESGYTGSEGDYLGFVVFYNSGNNRYYIRVYDRDGNSLKSINTNDRGADKENVIGIVAKINATAGMVALVKATLIHNIEQFQFAGATSNTFANTQKLMYGYGPGVK